MIKMAKVFLAGFLTYLSFMTSTNLLAIVVVANKEATVARGGSGGIISVSFTIQGITKVLGTNDAPNVKKYAHRLKVLLKEVDPTIYLAIEDFGPESSNSFDYTIPEVDDEVVTQRADGVSWDVGISFQIVARSEDILKADLAQTNNKITILIEYAGPDDTNRNFAEIEAVIENRVPRTAPDFTSAASRFGAAELFWTPQDVTYSNGSTESQVKTRVFAIPAGQGEVAMTGIVFDAEADADTETRDCVVNTDAADGEACLSCTPGVGNATELIYLRTSELPEGMITASSNTRSDTSVSISGLEHDENDEVGVEYIGFLTYDPDGTGYSSCKKFQSSKNYAYLERLDTAAKSDWAAGSACVIATAAYGSPWAHELQILRHFRDTYLLTNPLGQSLVKKYYEFGPKLVPIVESSPVLKWLIKGVLTPVTFLISWFV